MIRNIKNLIINFAIREEEKEGVNFLIVPIVALVEGVHAGSGGAGFYPSGEINRTAQNWNGVPLTIDHPADAGGNPITANNPDTLKKYAIGTFENVRYEGGKLKGEGWIIKERIELLSPQALEMLTFGRKMEVSTGLFTGSDGMPGKWHGEEFEETLTDFIPDHLALLPNAEGACNFDAGCGVRLNKELGCGKCLVNKKGGEANVKKKIAMDTGKHGNEGYIEYIGIHENHAITAMKKAGFWVNEISHSKIREQLFKAISDMNTPGTFHFLREVFNKTFIFEKVTDNDAQLFRLSYKLNKEDEIVVGKGNPIEVKEKVEFITINEEVSMDRKTKVASLIANEKLPFTQEDEGQLLSLSDEGFDRLYTLNECKCAEDADALVKANARVEELETKVSEQEEVIKVNDKNEADKDAPKIVKFADILANASVQDREAWNGMVAEKKTKKDNAVKLLLEAEGNKFTEEELQAMPFDTLENIISMSPVKANYGGNGSIKPLVTEVKTNERQKDGSGVPDMVEERWTPEGKPDFSHLDK